MTRTEAPIDPRQFSRISNDLPRNRKIIATGNIGMAIAAHVAAITYCGDSLTDGFFSPDYIVRSINAPADFAETMARQRLWHLPSHDCDRCPQPGPGEAVVHDYLRHNRSAAEVLELTDKRRESGRRGAESRWGGSSKPPPPGKPPRGPMPNAMASAMPNAMANGSQVDGRAEQSRADSGTGTYAANGRNAREADEPPNNEPAGPAEKIITGWISKLRARPQSSMVADIGVIVAKALHDEVPEDDVRDALDLWQDKVNANRDVGPGLLKSIIHQVSQRDPVAAGTTPGTVIALPATRASPPRESTTDARVAVGLAIADLLEAQGA